MFLLGEYDKASFGYVHTIMSPLLHPVPHTRSIGNAINDQSGGGIEAQHPAGGSRKFPPLLTLKMTKGHFSFLWWPISSCTLASCMRC